MKHKATVGEGCHSQWPGNPRNERIPHKDLFICSFRRIFTDF